MNPSEIGTQTFGSGPRGRRFESSRPDHFSQQKPQHSVHLVARFHPSDQRLMSPQPRFAPYSIVPDSHVHNLPADSLVDSSRQIATLHATREGVVDRAPSSRYQHQLNEDDRYTLMRYAHFRAAAEYIAAAFAAMPTVS